MTVVVERDFRRPCLHLSPLPRSSQDRFAGAELTGFPNSSLFPRQVAASCPFAAFHEDVVSGKVRFPCLMTPADSTEGHDALSSKKRRRESPATVERWRAASRRYPPWQYRSTAPDPPTREWLQLLPSGYTAAARRCRTRACVRPLVPDSGDGW